MTASHSSPPPRSLDAERRVIRDMIAGVNVHSETLKPDHFFLAPHPWMFGQLVLMQSMDPKPRDRAALLIASAPCGTMGMVRAFIDQCVFEPFDLTRSLDEDIDEIIEMANRRAVVELCQLVESRLRTNTTTAEKALLRLKRGLAR